MKTKIIVGGFVITILCLIYISYNILTTIILLKNAEARQLITPDISYRFASTTLDGQSLVLFRVQDKDWPDNFIHRLQLSLSADTIKVQAKNFHIHSYQIALHEYGAYLPDALDDYNISTRFINDWPLSLALFDLLTPHTILDMNIQKNSLHTYQFQLRLYHEKVLMLTASGLIDISQQKYNILQAQAHIHDGMLLKKIQNYAQSRHQQLPDSNFTITRKN